MQFLTRQHDTWYFRRRVPKPLQERLGIREIYRSLCTSDRRKAKREAALLYVASEALFEVAKKEPLSDEELRAIARHWLNDQLQLKQKIEEMPPGKLADFEAPNTVPKYRPFIYPDLNGMNQHHHERRRDAHLSRPGKPTDNAFIEAFNARLRAECLNAHWFLNLADAAEKLEAWRRDYNEQRPHSAIGNKVPETLMKSAHVASLCR